MTVSPVVRQTLQHWAYRLCEADFIVGAKRVKEKGAAYVSRASLKDVMAAGSKGGKEGEEGEGKEKGKGKRKGKGKKASSSSSVVAAVPFCPPSNADGNKKRKNSRD